VKEANYRLQRGFMLRKYWPNLTGDEACAEYDRLYKLQDGKCALCGKTGKELNKLTRHGSRTRKLVVDHCHKTNSVRGLLCNKCNSGIGFLEDSIVLCYKAYKYLLRHYF
jgi:hypothetical protein